MKCGACGEDKKREAFEIRGRPVGENICYDCTKLIRAEKRRAYIREYYRQYRLDHPEETLKAQKKSQEKLKARRKSEKLQKAIKAYVAENVIQAKEETSPQSEKRSRLEEIKRRLEETQAELNLEMEELKRKGDQELLEEIKRHELRTKVLIRSVEEKMKSEE